MDSNEKVVETQENEFIDYSIVKEEYELNEASVPVVPIERTSGDFPANSKEVVSFEIIEVEQKNYKCFICDARFRNNTNLKNHMSKHTNVRNFKCAHCAKAFKAKRFVLAHLKTHIKQPPVKCDICNKTMKDSLGLRVHKKKQHFNLSPEMCQICGKVMKSKLRLTGHIKRMHKSDGAEEWKPLICPICGKLCELKHNFESHMKSHSIPIECNICFRTFATRRMLTDHKRSHKPPPGKVFVCEICNKAFTTKSYLTSHEKIHLPEEEDPVKCIYCSMIFRKVYSLEWHIKRDHRGLPKKIGADPKCTICKEDCKSIEDLKKHIEKSHIRKKRLEKCFECAFCVFKTSYKFRIADHLKTVHLKKKNPYNSLKRLKQCPICSKPYPSRTITVHMRTHSNDKPFSCDLCNKAFKTKRCVTRHQKIHLPRPPRPVKEDPVKCIYCCKILRKANSLQSHIENQHTGLPTKLGADPTCTICKTDCKSIKDLKKHIENSHDSKKRFECAICGLKANYKSIMAKHLVTVHFKMKNLKYYTVCPICSKSYPSGSITEHMRTHSEVKTFSCDLCNKAFKTIDSLRKHKRRHNSITIECIYCKKICKNKISFQLHMRRFHRGLPLTSTGPPFKCSICFVTYTSLSSLVEHVTTHEASYKCASCNRKYIHKQNLEKHFEEVHHKETLEPK